VLLTALLPASSALAATKSWNKNTSNSDSTDNLTTTGNWTPSGVPGSGDDAVMGWTRSTSSPRTKIVTNAATDIFVADSLSISNRSNKDTVFIYVRGTTYLTNGTGALIFGGADSSPITLNFSNSVTFKTASFIGSTANASLNFAGAGTIRGSNLTFTGNAAGNNLLTVTAAGGMFLSGDLTMTGGESGNTITLATNTTVAGLLSVAGNLTDTYFAITNGTLAVTNGISNTGRIDVLNHGVLNVVSAWTNSGVLVVNAGGLVTGNTLTNQAGATITGSGVINSLVVNEGRIHFSGAFSNNVLQTAGSFTLSGVATITGVGTIAGGTIDLAGNRLTTPLLVIGSGGAWTNATTPNSTLDGSVSNAGTVFFSRDVYITGAVTNTGTWTQRGVISNQIYNAGTLTLLKNSINPRVTGGIINVGSLTMDLNASATVEGSVTNSGSVAFAGQILGNYVQTGGSLTVSSTGAGVLNVIGGAATISAGSFDLNGRMYSNSLMAVSSTGALTNGVAGAAFYGALSNAANVAVTADTFFNGTITNTGLFAFRGAVSNTFANSGTLLLNGTGTITGALVNQSGGDVRVTNGTLRLLAAPTQNGTITIAAGNTLSITPAWANAGSVQLNGGLLVAGTTTNTAAGSIVGFGTISNQVVNLGVITATNGTLNLVVAPVQSNTVNVVSSGTLTVGQAWRNSGSVNLAGGTVIGSTLTNAGTLSGAGTVTAPLVNLSGATVTASGGGTLTLTAAPLQNGTVNILGTLNVTSAWSNGNAGVVNLNGGVLTGATLTVDGTVQGHGTLAANVVLSNGETITINGGQLNLTGIGTLTGGTVDGGPLNNYGTVTGFGTLSAAVSNPGYIRATNGLLYIQTLTGNQATGTLEASAGGTLQANGLTKWINDGRVILSGGTVIGGNISNNSARLITGYGTIAAAVENAGTIQATSAGTALWFDDGLRNLSGGVVTADTARLVVNGAFTNSGTFTMMHGLGTFNGSVVNAGAWITDPTTNVFNDTFTITSSGYISMAPGDVYVFTNDADSTGHFINLSTQSNSFDTLEGKFLFSGTSGVTQQFYVAGHNIGAVAPGSPNATNAVFTDFPHVPGYSNNFALGTLEISAYSTVRVDDVFSTLGPGTNDNITAGLYLRNLFMGLDSLLIIGSNVQVYFVTSNDWSSANFLLEGNATYDNAINGLHQMIIVPEPSALLLWGLGLAVTVFTRRHFHRRTRRD
jgi:hypothetical protein